MFANTQSIVTLAALLFAGVSFAQTIPPETKAKVDAKAKQLQAWSTDPQVVAAVKSYNASPSAEAKAMSNDKWKSLTLLDPFVRSLSKNALGEYLKSKQDPQVVEMFISGADGTKVAFLSKTTSWSHKGKDKFEVPMTGKTWVGPMEVDESTGQQSIQIGLPVLDGGKPIGAMVIGIGVSKL